MEGYDPQQLKHRERHGGLEWDMVRVGLRTLAARLRALCDKRLVESLDDGQIGAMGEIATAYHILTGGMGVKTCSWMRLPSTGSGDIDAGAVLQADYVRWRAKCRDFRLDAGMALDVIVFGMSLREVDRNRRQAKGRAGSNLRGCLDLWGV